MENVHQLGDFEAKELLRYFLHYMKQGSEGGQRKHMAERYPQTYNKLYDRKIVEVRWTGN